MRAKNSLSAPALVFVCTALLLASRFVNASLLEYRDNIYLSVIILQLLIFVLPGIFYCKLKGTGYVMRLNFRPFGARKILFVLLCLLTLICGTVLMKIGLYRLGFYTGEYTFFGAFIPSGITYDIAGISYLVLAFAVLPALCEEFIFRSVVLSEYTEQYGSLCAVLLSGVLYALAGFSTAYLPLNFFVGIMLGFAACVTKSVFASIIIRLGYNLFGLFFEYNLSTMLRQTENLMFFALISTALLLFFAFFMFSETQRLYYIYAVTRTDDTISVTTERESLHARMLEGIFSPTLLLCILVFTLAVLM